MRAALVATCSYTPLFVEQVFQMASQVYGQFKMGDIGYQMYEFNTARLGKAAIETERQAKLLTDMEAQEEARRTRMDRTQKILTRLEELERIQVFA